MNEQHGTVNSSTSGYHETITFAYLQLIDEFLSTFAPEVPFDERVEQLLAGPLAERSFLLRFWSKELLMSPVARAEWVPPDLQPLAIPADALAGLARGQPESSR